jgi:hypothetical protein
LKILSKDNENKINPILNLPLFISGLYFIKWITIPINNNIIEIISGIGTV